MHRDIKMVPVLQLDDLAALQAASKHLDELGFRSDVGPFGDLPAEQHAPWMTPANGGYLFYLDPNDRYEEAMSALGRFFGCTD